MQRRQRSHLTCAVGRQVWARRKHISQINLGPNGALDYAQRWQIPAVSAVSRRQTAPMRTLKVKSILVWKIISTSGVSKELLSYYGARQSSCSYNWAVVLASTCWFCSNRLTRRWVLTSQIPLSRRSRHCGTSIHVFWAKARDLWASYFFFSSWSQWFCWCTTLVTHWEKAALLLCLLTLTVVCLPPVITAAQLLPGDFAPHSIQILVFLILTLKSGLKNSFYQFFWILLINKWHLFALFFSCTLMWSECTSLLLIL